MKKIRELLYSLFFEYKKEIIIMQNAILLMIVSMSYAANSYSQGAKINLKLENTTVKEVLYEIENQSEFYFIYNDDLIDVTRKINISVKNKKIDDVLILIFDSEDVRIFTNDRYIILTPKNYGQQNTISGMVTNEFGEPLPGVDVLVKGTNNGTSTNFDGAYSLSNVDPNAILVFSYLGMISQEVKRGDQEIINIKMIEDSYGLDEVIVTGYSTVKKRDITGSISSITSKDLSKSGSVNLAQTVQGKTAGVYITRQNGRPGEGVSVRIRGMGGINDSEPLYVVDGIYGGSLSGINPNEIESIEILKDASSAAIYGARGANGVVLITTKKGKAGKMQVSYNGSIGFQNIINSGDVQMLNAGQYGEVQNTMFRNDGFAEPFGDPNRDPALFPVPSQLGAGTDWMEEMYSSNVPTQDHLLSFSGGTEKHTANISLSYINQEGLLLNSGYEKFNFRVNTDHKINKWLNIGNRTSFGNGKTTGSSRSDNKYGDFYFTLLAEPTIPVFNEDGTLAGPPSNFYMPNRTPYAKNVSSDPVSKSYGISNLFYLELKPLEYLTFKTNLINGYWSQESTNHINNIFDEGIVGGSEVNVSGGNTITSEWTWNNLLSFDKEFGDHSVKALVGYEMRHSNWNNIYGNSIYLDPSYRVIQSGAAETSNFDQSRGEESMISYFGNVTYNYKEKYYLTGNIRRDGSSRFGENNRFGIFPSFSVAWRLSEESFFPDLFDDFKLRASWGQVGNDKIGSYRYIAPMANVFYSMTGQNASFDSGMVIKGLANTDLKWETSTQTNIGIDMTLFNYKLHLVADYFVTDVTDMLLGKTIPVTSGIGSLAWGRYESVITNVGALTNKGFELELGYTDRVGDFTYSINANLTTYSNEVTNLGENEYLSGSLEGDIRNRTYVGGSLGDFYGYVNEGIFQTQAELDAANALNPDAPYQANETIPGDFKFKDLNGDGTITDADRKILGSPIPDFTYGLGLDLGYKRLSFSALFYGSQGNLIYNSLRSELEQQGRSMNKATTVLDAWHGEGTSNSIPIRRTQDLNTNFRTSSTYLEDGSFLRLQNIMFSYDLPVLFGEMQVFVSGDNLITFTDYSGFNPEVSITKAGDGGNRLDSGVDMGYYPSSSIYRIGFRVTF